MKKIFGWFAGISLLSILSYFFLVSTAQAVDIVKVAEDVYDFRMVLKVPQVLDNTSSLGYRKFKTQTIKGSMSIVWNSDNTYSIEFGKLENQQFRVRGNRVTYDAVEDSWIINKRFTWIGDNKKEVFKTPALCFYLELTPNYAIGGNEEDNSFYVALSGSGTSSVLKDDGYKVARRFSGYAAGTQGCGCAAYGHKSPTRIASIVGPSQRVDDVVATYGTWRATFKNRKKYF